MDLLILNTPSAQNLQEFIDGKLMDERLCQRTVNELAAMLGNSVNYKQLVSAVKRQLNANSIILHHGIVHVSFTGSLINLTEVKATLIRLLNFRYKGEFPIILNEEITLFIPAACKNNISPNMLTEYYTLSSKEKRELAKIRDNRVKAESSTSFELVTV